MVSIDKQSPEIAQSLVQNGHDLDHIGAGDQVIRTGFDGKGIVFGYATDETEEMMPLSLQLAHRLAARLAELRRNGEMPWLRPDCKTQVTVEYRLEAGGVMTPLRVHTVVLSTQHHEQMELAEMRSSLMKRVVEAVIPAQYRDAETIYHLQPSGSFVLGGPMGDAGLTGRKIIVDTYGGWGAHGGGAFSGKDWSKVDRSAAYAARWVAKSLVAAGLCRRCLIQLSYAIGVAHPLTIHVDSYGTGKVSDAELIRIINANFDLRPGVIVRELGLLKPIYEQTACYGHFGRPLFAWEHPKPLKQ